MNQAIWLITTGAREASFRNVKTIAECLADELINAAKGSSNSYAIKKKDEPSRGQGQPLSGARRYLVGVRASSRRAAACERGVLKGIDDLASLVCNAARGWARDDPRDQAFKRTAEESSAARGVYQHQQAPATVGP